MQAMRLSGGDLSPEIDPLELRKKNHIGLRAKATTLIQGIGYEVHRLLRMVSTYGGVSLHDKDQPTSFARTR